MKAADADVVLRAIVALFPAQHPACAAYLQSPREHVVSSRPAMTRPTVASSGQKGAPTTAPRPLSRPTAAKRAPVGGTSPLPATPPLPSRFAAPISVVPEEWRGNQPTRALSFEEVSKLQAQVKRLAGISGAAVEEAEGCIVVNGTIDGVPLRLSVAQTPSPQSLLVEAVGAARSPMWVMEYAALTPEHLRELARVVRGPRV